MDVVICALQGDRSKTRMDAEQVQSEAAELGVAVYALHLKTPAGRDNHAKAEATYRSLTANAYLQEPLYFPVSTGSVKQFGRTVDTLADSIIDHVRRASTGETVATWMNWVDAMVPPAPATFLGGAGQASAEAESYVSFTLEPGRYAWVSEEHGLAGMVHEFTVE